ncbi:membrane-bound O-acyltransferase gup1 isoform X1 [Telopea speciosissima]|uniref:membrane-bound O-acyltransferase gup1 isoform X1 n=2 Tax=Telopea speciosissima TaxID=54955 RepID=UPI001CC72651|nr:membrane-bound O-acyltransferase gup1 isoform X1 [Telopea speciosissima]
MDSSRKNYELIFLSLYALAFYAMIICRSLQLSHDHLERLFGLRHGWIANLPNDVSDSQWRNFRGNLPVLTLVMVIFILVANILRAKYCLKSKGMSIVWLSLSLSYLSYLHGACVIFIISIASANYFLVKIFSQSKYFLLVLWIFNIFFLLCNRVYEGYSFSIFGQRLAFLDSYRGTFRWHVCFNFVILRMISYGCDYYWAQRDSCVDQKKHIQRCHICSSGKKCYVILQDRSVDIDKFSLGMYLCYLVYAPLYIAGPIISFNAFASQLDIPQRNYSTEKVAWYGIRWILSLFLMELMTHFLYYNAFATSGVWKQLSPLEVFIIGYGVLNFMWLKFLLIWRYFRFWALVGGVEAPENMPRCINNCYDLESFWKNWHASFNKWLVRYLYIPLGGSHKKLLNVWVIFTFVAIWHDLEWKLISWAWLTCLFFIPEIIMKSAVTAFQAKDAFGEFVLRELNAVSGAFTITCLMVANLVGYVIGPSGGKWLINRFLQKDGIPVLGGMFATFYVGTKLMFYIRDARQRSV